MSDSDSDEIDSVDLLAESFVNLDKKFELLAEHTLMQTKLFEKILENFKKSLELHSSS